MNLKIVTYNIRRAENSTAILENISRFATEGVEIFCLQEVWQGFRGIDICKLLLQKLGYDWQLETFPSEEPGNFDYGLCILWKKNLLHVKSFDKIRFPILGRLRFWEKWVHRHHNFPAIPSKRGILIGNFILNGQLLRIITVHLDWQGGKKRTITQLQFLNQLLKKLDNVDYQIISGDFNTLGFLNRKKTILLMQRILGGGFKNVIQKSYSTVSPFQQLDYIFVQNMNIKKAEILKVKGSDHFPLMAELQDKPLISNA